MSQAPTAEVFAALGDSNRQRLLLYLAGRGSASATTLARPLSVTRQAVDKHLRVLLRAGLVEPTRTGREVLYTLRTSELQRSAEWLTDVADAWDRRLAGVKAIAEAAGGSPGEDAEDSPREAVGRETD